MAYDSESIIATSIERLNDKMDKIDSKVETVQQDVNKFVVLFEKLAHLEKVHEDNNKRTHHRIDEVSRRVEKIEDSQNNGGCPTFKSFKAQHDADQKHNDSAMNGLSTFKKELESRAGKKLDGYINIIITVIITAVVAYFLTKAGIR